MDRKAESRLRIIGLLIYRSCDKISKDLLGKEETKGKLTLKGSDEGKDRTKLVENIINGIPQDTATEKLYSEVDMLSKIHNCKRKNPETTDACASRFDGAVAKICHTYWKY